MELNCDSYLREVKSDLGLTIQTVGIQGSYQLIFSDRLALDLVIIGPGLANYSAKIGFNTSLAPEDEA